MDELEHITKQIPIQDMWLQVCFHGKYPGVMQASRKIQLPDNKIRCLLKGNHQPVEMIQSNM